MQDSVMVSLQRMGVVDDEDDVTQQPLQKAISHRTSAQETHAETEHNTSLLPPPLTTMYTSGGTSKAPMKDTMCGCWRRLNTCEKRTARLSVHGARALEIMPKNCSIVVEKTAMATSLRLLEENNTSGRRD